MNKLDSVLANLPGRRVGVMGLGVAGAAMAVYLARRGAQVLGVDARHRDLALADAARHAWKIDCRLGPTPQAVFAGCDAVAVSPGVAFNHPAVAHAAQAGVPTFGELELAVPPPCPCIAVTGTNGKSTTTALLGSMLQAFGYSTFVGGNLGPPIAGWLDVPEGAQVAALEVSSYQLDGTSRFAPQVGVWLNVAPDHLQRYGSFEAYVRSKARLLRMVPADGRLVLNYDDPNIRAAARAARAPVYWLSTAAALPHGLDGAALQQDDAVGAPQAPLRWAPQGSLWGLGPLRLQHSRLLGTHNLQNALAATLAAVAFAPHGAMHAVQAAYDAFAGLPHRLEEVGVHRGARYINDSKATNDAAAATAVLAMSEPIVLLVGGADKGGGYARLHAAVAARRVRAIVAFGAAAPVLQMSLGDLGAAVTRVDSLEDALARAESQARPGDVVLLAPGCASFDAFANYEERGEMMRAWVRQRR